MHDKNNCIMYIVVLKYFNYIDIPPVIQADMQSGESMISEKQARLNSPFQKFVYSTNTVLLDIFSSAI